MYICVCILPYVIWWIRPFGTRITRNTILMYGQHGQDYWASIWLNWRIYMKYIVFYSIDGSCVFCYQLRQVSTVLPWLGSCKFLPVSSRATGSGVLDNQLLVVYMSWGLSLAFINVDLYTHSVKSRGPLLLPDVNWERCWPVREDVT